MFRDVSEDGAGEPVDRRSVLAILAAGAFLAACSSSAGKHSGTAASNVTTSTEAGTATGSKIGTTSIASPSTSSPSTSSPSTSSPTTSSPTPSSPTPSASSHPGTSTTQVATTTNASSTTESGDEYSTTPTTLDVPAVASGEMRDDDVQALVSNYVGTWLGSWADDTGASGTGQIGVAIDLAARLATIDVSYEGPIVLGDSPAPATYRFPIDGFVDVPEEFSIPTAGYGAVAVSIEGFGQSRLIATNVHGHPEIERIELKSVFGQVGHAALTYTINETSGTIVHGAITFARGGDRPPTPASTSESPEVGLISGDTAAALTTAAELTAATGQSVGDPQANGGKANYAPGVTVSNATAKSADGGVIVQWTLYRGADLASIQAYWHSYDSNTPVPGLGDDAKTYAALHMLYVLRGNDALQLEIIDPSKNGSALDAEILTVAQSIVARMGGH